MPSPRVLLASIAVTALSIGAASTGAGTTGPPTTATTTSTTSTSTTSTTSTTSSSSTSTTSTTTSTTTTTSSPPTTIQPATSTIAPTTVAPTTLPPERATFTATPDCYAGYALLDVVVSAVTDTSGGEVRLYYTYGVGFTSSEPSETRTLPPLAAGQTSTVRFSIGGESDYEVELAVGPGPWQRTDVHVPECPLPPTAPTVSVEVERCAVDEDGDGTFEDDGAFRLTITNPPGGPEYDLDYNVAFDDSEPSSDLRAWDRVSVADGESVTVSVEQYQYPYNPDDGLFAGDYHAYAGWWVDVPGIGPRVLVSESVPITLPTCEPTYLPEQIRVASLDAPLSGLVGSDASSTTSPAEQYPQAAAVAEIIQEARPDIVLLSEFDAGPDGAGITVFQERYLAVGHGHAEPIDYPHVYTAPVNGGPEHAMVLLSRYPIDTGQVRTFQNLPWAALPHSRVPRDPLNSQPADDLGDAPLSSTSLWDIPVVVDSAVLHVLATHAIEPVDELTADRNADEIGFWAQYVAGDDGSWIVDDAGDSGGLAAGAEFVILGSLNADPADGDSRPGAIQQLLNLERIQDAEPQSEGAIEATELQGGANLTHEGDPATDTADLADDPAPGNLRLDYVLASDGLDDGAAGVWWPASDHELAHLLIDSATQHHLVWVDLR